MNRPDGNKYEGEWKDGKQDGHGWYTNKKGDRREGIWSKGKRVKWLGESITISPVKEEIHKENPPTDKNNSFLANKEELKENA